LLPKPELQAHHAHRDHTDHVLRDHALMADDLTVLAQMELLQQEEAVLNAVVEAVADLVEAPVDTATHADHHAVPLPARAVPKTQVSTANTFCLQQKASFVSSHSAVSKKSERT